MLHDALQHRGDNEAVGYAVGLDGVEPGAGIELRKDHHLPPAPDGGEHGGGASDVVEGHRYEKHVDVFSARVGGFDGVRHIDRHSEIGEDDPLGQRRCAARVDDDGRVVVFDISEDLFGLMLGNQVVQVRYSLGPRVDTDRVSDGLEVGLDLVRQLEVALADEENLRLGVVAHVGELFLFGAIGQGHEDGAQLRAGVVDLDILHRVEGHHRDLVALGDAQGLKGACEAVDPFLHFREGPRSLPANHRRAIRHDRRGDHQEFGCVHGWPPENKELGTWNMRYANNRTTGQTIASGWLAVDPGEDRVGRVSAVSASFHIEPERFKHAGEL